MTHPKAFTEIAENLSFLDDWEDRYRYIIELGQKLPALAPEERNAGNKVSGCVSQVWLVSGGDAAHLTYRGESDALIVRGLVAILLAIYEDMSPAEARAVDAPGIFAELGLKEHLTPQRSNGFASMVARIRIDARALAG